MAKIEISIDTTDKANSTVTIDGKKLKNVSAIYIYSMHMPEYMNIEINQYEKMDDEEDGMRKRTILTASAESNWDMKDISIERGNEDREVLLKALSRNS